MIAGVAIRLLGVVVGLLGVSMRFFSMAVELLGVAVTQRLSVSALMVGLLGCGGYIGILGVILAVGW